MTEIQRLLKSTIDELNVQEKRDNRPRFSISFIRNHPWLFVAMYAAFLATLIVMLRSETLVDSVWLLIVLFVLLNGFFSLTFTRAIAMKTLMFWTSAFVITGSGTTLDLFPVSSSTESRSRRASMASRKLSCKK